MKGIENLSPLHKAILTEAQQDADELISQAEVKAKSIQQREASRANAAARLLIAAANEEAVILRERSAARAQLDAQMLKLKRREDLLQQVFKAARTQLVLVPQQQNWSLVAHALLTEAVEELGSQSDPDGLIVHADPVTQEVMGVSALSDISKKYVVRLLYGSPLTGKNGILLTTHDGHRQFDNTLETRFERKKDALRAVVYRMLSCEQS